MTLRVAVGVAGRIGSGKTTLAEQLAQRLDCVHASFGNYVRAVAIDRGISDDRDNLQTLGDELLGGGWDNFCSSVLNHAGYVGGAVVVDGIRHLAAVSALQRLVDPVPWQLIGVDAPDDTRVARLRGRGVSLEEARRADAHSNESEVDRVLALADLRLLADVSVEDAVEQVMAWLQREGDLSNGS